ncbi:MAG: transcriptional repressor [Oscillospiraceae bacterium]|nr:transcriptional repressor [Oscillospiraceae bacterium]
MSGRRYSRQREMIYHCVQGRHDHPTAEMVYQQLKPTSPGLSLGTVYRNLNLLTDEGQLLRLPFTVDRYDANTAPHGHLECRTCGQVIDLDGDASKVCDLFASANAGNDLECCTVIFRGQCADCRAGYAAQEA